LVECGLAGPPPSGKWSRTAPPAPAEASVIHTLASLEPEKLWAVDGVEEIPLAEEHPERTVQLDREMDASTRRFLVELLHEYRDVFAFGLEEMPGVIPP